MEGIACQMIGECNSPWLGLLPVILVPVDGLARGIVMYVCKRLGKMNLLTKIRDNPVDQAKL
jgi:hypothetical protein